MKNDWSSRDAKRNDWTRKLPTDDDYRIRRSQYTTDSKNIELYLRSNIEKFPSDISQSISNGKCQKAKNHANDNIKTWQSVIDDMVTACSLFETPPTLVLHQQDSHLRGAFMWVQHPRFISMPNKHIDYFLSNPSRFRMIAAHELAHIANQDTKMENKIAAATSPPSRKQEMRADLLGAIIHGNPKEYFEEMKQMTLAKEPEARVRATTTELSYNARTRMMEKWVGILMRDGAIDQETGAISNLPKALDIYSSATDMIELMAEFRDLYMIGVPPLVRATSRSIS